MKEQIEIGMEGNEGGKEGIYSGCHDLKKKKKKKKGYSETHVIDPKTPYDWVVNGQPKWHFFKHPIKPMREQYTSYILLIGSTLSLSLSLM
jgi:hypothetical protein